MLFNGAHFVPFCVATFLSFFFVYLSSFQFFKIVYEYMSYKEHAMITMLLHISGYFPQMN